MRLGMVFADLQHQGGIPDRLLYVRGVVQTVSLRMEALEAKSLPCVGVGSKQRPECPRSDYSLF